MTENVAMLEQQTSAVIKKWCEKQIKHAIFMDVRMVFVGPIKTILNEMKRRKNN